MATFAKALVVEPCIEKYPGFIGVVSAHERVDPTVDGLTISSDDRFESRDKSAETEANRAPKNAANEFDLPHESTMGHGSGVSVERPEHCAVSDGITMEATGVLRAIDTTIDLVLRTQ